MSHVCCEQLHKSFTGVAAVRGLDLQIAPGEILALLGPSGCGKTTVLRLIAGFEQPDGGQISIAGRTVAQAGRSLAPELRQVGMVFQHHALFPHLNVAGNVGFGLRGPAPLRREQVAAMLELVGLRGLEARMPHQLSGGQQQRVALARALAPRPAVLLLDEPFSNLDADLRVTMRAQVRAIIKQVGSTALFVTHDQDEALFMGDRVAVMRGGRLEQAAPASAIFLTPATRFVAEFMGVADFVPAVVVPGGLRSPIGELVQPVAAPPGTVVDLLVRPDDLELCPDPQGNARIAGRTFRGGDYLYEVRLDSQHVVRCLCNHIHDYPDGAQVRVRLIPGHALACFPAANAPGAPSELL